MPAFAISAFIVVYLFANSIFTPLMPSLTVTFSASEEKIQQLISIYFLGSMISCVFIGPIGDALGRLRCLKISSVLFIIPGLVSLFTPNIEIFLFSRFIQGIFGAPSIALGFAAIQQIYGKEGSVGIMAMMGSVFGLAPAIAPAIGGWCAEYYSWRSVFILTSTLAVLASLLILRFMPIEEQEPKKLRIIDPLMAYFRVLKNEHFMVFAIFPAILVIFEWYYLTIMPFYAIDVLNISPDIYGYSIGASTLLIAIGSMIATRLKHLGQIKIITFAWLLVALSACGIIVIYLTSPQQHQFYYLMLCYALVILAMGISFTITVPHALSFFKEDLGTASSARSLIVIIAASIGSFLVKGSVDYDISNMAIFAGVITIILYGFLLKAKELSNSSSHNH